MTARPLQGALVAFLAITILASAVVAATVTLTDFQHALYEIPVSSDERILAAVDFAIQSEGFPINEVYRLVERLATVNGAASDKEAMLLTVTAAIEDGIPVDGLLNKAFEGLARSVALGPLSQLLNQRLRLFIESRDLFYSKGIFRAPLGTPEAPGSAALPALRFDALLTNLGDALGDYLESGGSPLEGHLIYRETESRLRMLRGVVLVAADVDLLLDRIDAEDLTRIALAALR
jgi:hypothetical protein